MDIAELDFDAESYKKPVPEVVEVEPKEPTETQKLEHELLKSLIKGD